MNTILWIWQHAADLLTMFLALVVIGVFSILLVLVLTDNDPSL